MTALNWIRKSAAEKGERVGEPFFVPAEAAAEDGVAEGHYRSRTIHFLGRVPGKMVHQLKREMRKGIVDGETLHIGGQYRSDWDRVEFWKTTYELVEIA